MFATLSTTNLAPSVPPCLSKSKNYISQKLLLCTSRLQFANEKDFCEMWTVGAKREPLFLGGRSGQLQQLLEFPYSDFFSSSWETFTLSAPPMLNLLFLC